MEKCINIYVHILCVLMRNHRRWRINRLDTHRHTHNIYYEIRWMFSPHTHMEAHAHKRTTRHYTSKFETASVQSYARHCLHTRRERNRARFHQPFFFLLASGIEGGCVSFILISFSYQPKFSIKLVFTVFVTSVILRHCYAFWNGQNSELVFFGAEQIKTMVTCFAWNWFLRFSLCGRRWTNIWRYILCIEWWIQNENCNWINR